MPRLLAVLLWLTTAIAPAIDVPATCGLELRITPEGRDLAGAYAAFTATLTNRGARPLTLILPGDGSADAYRTPLVEWAYSPRGLSSGRWCGNINTLRRGEVFTLAPGEARELGEWARPDVPRGTHLARMLYINEPKLEWRGITFEGHDPGEMLRVRASDRCSAVSNQILVSGLGSRR